MESAHDGAGPPPGGFPARNPWLLVQRGVADRVRSMLAPSARQHDIVIVMPRHPSSGAAESMARRAAAEPAVAAAEPSPEAVAQLQAMGFDEARARQALASTGNDVERALHLLL